MNTCERAWLRAAVVVIGLCASAPLSAQTTFKIADRDVQVHGSVQQGVAVTDDNNFLTLHVR